MYSKIQRTEKTSSNTRLRLLAICIALGGFVIIVRLFVLMVLEHNFYLLLADTTHDISSTLFPKRGSIFIQDSRTREVYPVALNQDAYILYFDTRAIHDDLTASTTAAALTSIFSYPPERTFKIFQQLNKRTDPYEPIEQKINVETMEKVKALDLPGVAFAKKPDRFYPEGNLVSSVVGFVGKNSAGDPVGRYGIEGFWNSELAGSGGFLNGAKSRGGELIALSESYLEPAKDGSDLVLTIDRSIQHYACDRLAEAMKEFEAVSASFVMMDPKTGAILAMCSIPDFDPNLYNLVDDPNVFNNSAIFTQYEPGSIFKPIVMASAINEGFVSPNSEFTDTGFRSGLCTKPIKNAGDKSYGLQTMTGILQNSINTGMVYVVEKLGKYAFREYVNKFGFGVKEGIELDTEVSGRVDSLYANKSERLDCYTATGSFGQGLTATPLQMATAFSAIANGGELMKPYIVDEIRYSDGRIEKTKPKEIREVLSRRTAKLVSGMLVQVVDHGYGGRARVPGYFVAGKSGTAQIPGLGGYTEDTNHSFIGFAPGNDPKFVMLVKFEKPKRTYAEVTAAPVFSDIARFALQYFQVPPER